MWAPVPETPLSVPTLQRNTTFWPLAEAGVQWTEAISIGTRAAGRRVSLPRLSRVADSE